MTPEQRRFFLEGVVPRRMQELAFCEVLCTILNRQREEHGATLFFGQQGMHTEDRRTFANPVLSSGVILCRGMLHFLGIKLRSGANPPTLMPRSPKAPGADDVVCEDFGVAPIPVGEFLKFTALHIADGEESVVATLQLANKEVAHLTELVTGKWEIRRLAYTCHLVNYLLNHYFRGSLKLPLITLPKFEAGNTRAAGSSQPPSSPAST